MPKLPLPGVPLREYVWKGPWKNARNWQRVTDPGATHPGSREFLPNPVNEIVIDDLSGAVRCEVCIEQWSGHAGTSSKRLRLNGGPWIDVPEPDLPVDGRPESYQYFRYPTVEIPLAVLREGANTFELTCGPQVTHDFGWGQWGIYGMTFRVYYESSRCALAGRVVVAGHDAQGRPILRAEISRSSAPVAHVRFIGRYEDFPIGGENAFVDWHFRYRHGTMQGHIGDVAAAPFEIAWNPPDWLPEQAAPPQVAAVITQRDGFAVVTGESPPPPLPGSDIAVKMYRPHDVPPCWQTRAGREHVCSVDISDDLSHAVAAKAVFVSWCGAHADAFGVNGFVLSGSVGEDHDYGYDEVDVPLEYLRPGRNRFFTRSATHHHGIEVMWPGVVLKVAYRRR